MNNDNIWLPEHSAEANLQGWDIFETNSYPERADTAVRGKRYGDRPFELQAVDDRGVFETDDKAWNFVRRLISNGDPLAIRAKAFLLEVSSAEHDAIFGPAGPWRLWAHDDKNMFWHLGEKWWVEIHGLSHPVVPVLATEDPQGIYWGWLDPSDKDPVPGMVWPSRGQLSMCFPYGLDAAIGSGEGRAVRLRIERREETDLERMKDLSERARG